MLSFAPIWPDIGFVRLNSTVLWFGNFVPFVARDLKCRADGSDSVGAAGEDVQLLLLFMLSMESCLKFR